MAKRRPNGAGMDPVKRADGRYAARVFVLQPDGGRKPKWVYSRDYDDCLRKRDELLSKVRNEIPVPARDMTLAGWLDYWLEEVVLPDSPYTTYAAYERQVRLRLKPLLGSKRLPELSMAHVRTARNSVVKQVSAATAVAMLTALRSALTAAMREDLLMRNVAALVEFPDRDDAEHEPWTATETARFFREAASHRLYAAFLLALLTGLRRSEIRGLRWQDIDLEVRTVRVRKQRQYVKVRGKSARNLEYAPKGKGRKKRKGAIGLPAALVEPLRQQRIRQEAQRMAAGSAWDEADLVFTRADGGPMHPDAVRNAFQRLAARLGLRKIRLHDLRHGASTMLADTGAKPHEAQAIMGHTKAETTLSVYTHSDLARQREALDRVAQLLSDTGELMSPDGVSPAQDTPPPATNE